MYINVYSSPNSNIQLYSSSSAHKVFLGTIRQLDEVPLSAQLEYSSRIVILNTGREPGTVKWLNSLHGK